MLRIAFQCTEVHADGLARGGVDEEGVLLGVVELEGEQGAGPVYVEHHVGRQALRQMRRPVETSWP